MARICCRRFSLVGIAVCMAAVSAATANAGERRSSRTITAPKFDDQAQQMELFSGLENGSFVTQVIAKGPESGFVLISNTTDQPLTVLLPETFVAIPVLKQFGPPNGGLGNQLGQNNGLNPNGNQQGQQGNQQPVGGGFNQQNGGLNQNGFNPNGNGLNNGAGPGLFSIPPERTIRLAYISACLAHGKPDPTPRSSFQLVRTQDYTTDEILHELIAVAASGEQSAKCVQAAIWHRSDQMAWEQLAAKVIYQATGSSPWFSDKDIQQAKDLVQEATLRTTSRLPDVVADSGVANQIGR